MEPHNLGSSFAMSWTKRGKKGDNPISRWSLGKLTKKRTASRLGNWPSTTPSLQIIAVSWWVDLCLNLTVLLRLAQKIISHSNCLRQAAGTIWTFQNFPTDFNRLGVGVTTNTEITHHLHRTSSAIKWHLHFLPGFAQLTFPSHGRCSSCDSNMEAKNESCGPWKNGWWCGRCETQGTTMTPLEPSRFINYLLHFLDLKTKPGPGLSDVQETALGINGFHYKRRLQKEFLPSFFWGQLLQLELCSRWFNQKMHPNSLGLILRFHTTTNSQLNWAPPTSMNMSSWLPRSAIKAKTPGKGLNVFG